MRFLFGGIAIFLLIAFIVGQIFTPRRAPLRKVFAKGFMITAVSFLTIGAVLGAGALIYYGITGNGNAPRNHYEKMSAEEKSIYVDSLLNSPPNTSIDELKDIFIAFRFGTTALPCFKSIHNFDVVSLMQIEQLEKGKSTLAGDIFETTTYGEFKTNQPAEEFHMKGTFTVQYIFSEGTRDKPLGWHFSKIIVSDCEVLSKHADPKVLGQDSLYPDLERRVKK